MISEMKFSSKNMGSYKRRQETIANDLREVHTLGYEKAELIYRIFSLE